MWFRFAFKPWANATILENVIVEQRKQLQLSPGFKLSKIYSSYKSSEFQIDVQNIPDEHAQFDPRTQAAEQEANNFNQIIQDITKFNESKDSPLYRQAPNLQIQSQDISNHSEVESNPSGKPFTFRENDPET